MDDRGRKTNKQTFLVVRIAISRIFISYSVISKAREIVSIGKMTTQNIQGVDFFHQNRKREKRSHKTHKKDFQARRKSNNHKTNPFSH